MLRTRSAHKTPNQPKIIVSAYMHLGDVAASYEFKHAISILGASDKLDWPEFGRCKTLRLRFDDTIHSTRGFEAPGRAQIAELIEFARSWGGSGTLLVHCRAGSSRSSAGALIAAAAVRDRDWDGVASQIMSARSYFHPNETMLRHADALLGFDPGLVELARFHPRPDRVDKWAPVAIPLI